jgi:hypothetical protein
VDNRERPDDEDLAVAAQRQNTNLRRLIASIGMLLAASRDLLRRLQSEEEAASGSEPGSDEC